MFRQSGPPPSFTSHSYHHPSSDSRPPSTHPSHQHSHHHHQEAHQLSDALLASLNNVLHSSSTSVNNNNNSSTGQFSHTNYYNVLPSLSSDELAISSATTFWQQYQLMEEQLRETSSLLQKQVAAREALESENLRLKGEEVHLKQVLAETDVINGSDCEDLRHWKDLRMWSLAECGKTMACLKADIERLQHEKSILQSRNKALTEQLSIASKRAMTGRIDTAVQHKLEDRIRQLESEKRAVDEQRGKMLLQVQEANENVNVIRQQWKQELMNLSSAEEAASISGILLRVGAKRQVQIGAFRRLIVARGEIYNDVRRDWSSANLIYACQQAIDQLQYLQNVCDNNFVSLKENIPFANAAGSSDKPMLPKGIQAVASDLCHSSIIAMLRGQTPRVGKGKRPHAVPQDAGRGFTVQDAIDTDDKDNGDVSFNITDVTTETAGDKIKESELCWVCNKGMSSIRGRLSRACECTTKCVHGGCLDEWGVIMAGTAHATTCSTCGQLYSLKK